MNNLLIRQTVERAAGRMMLHQRADGAFSYCCEVSPLPDAVMVIFLHLMEERAGGLTLQLCQDLLKRQRADGGWTAYPDQSENVSATILAVFALRLAEYPAHRQIAAAKRYVLQHGGIESASNLTKVILAVAGQIPWSSLPDGHIEFSLLGPSAPLNMFDFSSFARLHLIPFMVLSHLQFRYQIPQSKGLEDLNTQPVTIPHLHLPFRNEPALRRCETFIVERIEPNGTLASYLTATVFAVFALQSLGYQRHHPIIRHAIQGLKEMVYYGRGFIEKQFTEKQFIGRQFIGKQFNEAQSVGAPTFRGQFVHQQLFTSTVWDTALSLQALASTQMPFYSPAIERAADYLLSRQQKKIGDWGVHSPGLKSGGWGFSDVNTLYPDLDDTAAVLKALYPFRKRFPSKWKKSVTWLLGMQNDDGGFAAFERNCNKSWLELIPINDMGRAMTDGSTPDMTGRVLDTLVAIRVRAPAAKRKAQEWLKNNQRPDGSWYGRWGICFIYGTWAAVIGQRANGVSQNHPTLKKAVAWLHTIQNRDGGFGESCQSDIEDRYISLGKSTPSQTAWALSAMMAATPRQTEQIEAAVEYLVRTADPQGGWREKYPTGSGVAGQAYLRYHSYPYVWPLLALSQYLRRYRET